MEVMIVFLVFFAMVFGIAYVFFTTRNKERLLMIEKGADASLFERKSTPFSIAKFILNIALLFMGIGLGIFLGWTIGDALGARHNQHIEVYVMSSVFIFGGLGLVTGFFITRKIEKADTK
tara:strand:+ start:109 stop:468 length:360 start_codon:yes stop_codon:yes gene_type:complete